MQGLGRKESGLFRVGLFHVSVLEREWFVSCLCVCVGKSGLFHVYLLGRECFMFLCWEESDLFHFVCVHVVCLWSHSGDTMVAGIYTDKCWVLNAFVVDLYIILLCLLSSDLS